MKSLRSVGMPRMTLGGTIAFSSTRGKIVVLLQHETRTVGELAKALNLTDNAVRAPRDARR
jgi:predicted transcriptional regulator